MVGVEVRRFLAFYRRQMAFPGITIEQTECVSTHISLDVLFYIAKKFSSQHFAGVCLTHTPLKYGPVINNPTTT